MAADRVTFHASTPVYLDYLAPVYTHLPLALRGPFRLPRHLRPQATALGIPDHLLANDDIISDSLAMVAGFQDLHAHTRGPVILLEHGCGQTYGSPPSHPANPGGTRRERVVLFLNSNRHSHLLNSAAYPATESRIVGFPSMDSWYRRDPLESLALLFHWDCRIHPAATWAFPDHKLPLSRLSAFLPSTLLFGHAHPRAYTRLSSWYSQSGYTLLPHLSSVAALAKYAIVDNSSAAFQLMSMGVIVGWLQAATYPGPAAALPPRFSDLAFQLPVLYPHGSIQEFLDDLFSNTPAHQEARAELARLYVGERGGAAARAAQAIRDFLGHS